MHIWFFSFNITCITTTHYIIVE
ncbi:uncharacterized protein METZ01_LOCUS303594 [marine metagenome]|uniref:Uncharacterized protein n=1 Tax=marine metagenome TaxID=408172 RepID=A0A382MQ62_9ZZZZ